MTTDRGLMGLRGIASLMVLEFHVGSALHLPFGQWIFGWGYAGVDLFFVISGYILTKKVLEGDYADPQTGRFSPARYYLRRFFRIWPVYYLALPLFVVLAATPFTPLQLVFGQEYLRSTFDGRPTWTLCVEEAFYAIVPIWALAFRTRAWKPTTLALFAITLSWGIFVGYPTESRYLLDQFPAYAFSYGVGAVAARGTRVQLPLWILGPIVAGTLPLLVVLQYTPMQTILAAGVGFGILGSWRSSPILTNPVAGFFGRLTYPIYLIGLPLQLGIESAVGSPGLWVPLTVGGTILGAWAASRAVEAPMIHVGRRVEKWLARASGPGKNRSFPVRPDG